jgi:anti-sigma regulatory factor (Ser/Thr protein kinase)
VESSRADLTLACDSGTILTNATVGNALKYTLSGKVTIKLFTDQGSSTMQEETASVTLLVEDTGIGMSKDFVSNDVFVPFRQADSHSPGTGLGLSIVKEVVKEFKGSLDVHSEPGKGSRVSVKFAAKLTEPSESSDDDLRSSLGIQGRHVRMFQLADYLGHPSPRTTKSVAGSLQRTASQWLRCETSTSRDMAPVPRGCICVVSEAELSALNKEQAGGVRILVETLAESDSRLLIFARSIASSQPEFEFENFKNMPIYVHQP